MEKQNRKLIVECADARLNAETTVAILRARESRDRIYVARSVGGSIMTLQRTLKRILSEEAIPVEAWAHTTCKGMGAVFECCRNCAPSDAVPETLLSPFARKAFTTREQLERLNEEVMGAAVRECADECGCVANVKTRLIDLAGVEMPKEGKPMLVYSTVSPLTPEELLGPAAGRVRKAFFLQADSIDEIWDDMKFMVAEAGIREIMLAAQSPAEQRHMREYAERIKSEGWANGCEAASMVVKLAA
jgi:hypothetical protein